MTIHYNNTPHSLSVAQFHTYLYHPLEHVSEGKVGYVGISVVEHAVYL